MIYNKYSDFLKSIYGEKIYKLPIQLPVTCPNRIMEGGCTFCSEIGTGFEAANPCLSVTQQLSSTKELIEKKYKAKKYIAYFQNYTNTYMPLTQFEKYMCEAAAFPGIVEISVSTRPDCINEDYLEVLNNIKNEQGIHITIELGLQTANYHTLDTIQRGHSLAEYIDAVLQIKKYGFTICTHVILNLPTDDTRDMIETAKILSAFKIDIVKIHSLYIAKNTAMAKEYLEDKMSICTKEEYYMRLRLFLEYLDPQIVIERLFSRIPEKDAVFSNWNTSWWKLLDEFMEYMEQEESYQGKKFHYLNGNKLKLLDNTR